MKKTDQKKYAAPALERGIAVLQVLEKHGRLRLEDISKYTNSPKASLLRYLDTLHDLGIVEKNGKTYRALMKLTKTTISSTDLNDKIHHSLYTLGEEFNVTTEWYNCQSFYKSQKLEIVLSQKYEPINQPVTLRAKVGFRRKLNEEFEATTRCAIKALSLPLDDVTYWQWGFIDDEFTQLPVKEPSKLIEKTGVMADKSYNLNGVRRFAAAVKNSVNGELLGVLCIAEHFRPNNDKTFEKKLKALRKEADSIEAYTNC